VKKVLYFTTGTSLL